MIEFALVLPILVILVFGIIEFGRAFNTQISLQSAVREGAREAALGGSNAEAVAATQAAAPSVDGASLIVTVLQDCPGGSDGEARVLAQIDFEFNIPFMALGTKTLEAEGVMRCGL